MKKETLHNGDEKIISLPGGKIEYVHIVCSNMPAVMELFLSEKWQKVAEFNRTPRSWIPSHFESNFCAEYECFDADLIESAKKYTALNQAIEGNHSAINEIASADADFLPAIAAAVVNDLANWIWVDRKSFDPGRYAWGLTREAILSMLKHDEIFMLAKLRYDNFFASTKGAKTFDEAIDPNFIPRRMPLF